MSTNNKPVPAREWLVTQSMLGDEFIDPEWAVCSVCGREGNPRESGTTMGVSVPEGMVTTWQCSDACRCKAREERNMKTEPSNIIDVQVTISAPAETYSFQGLRREDIPPPPLRLSVITDAGAVPCTEANRERRQEWRREVFDLLTEDLRLVAQSMLVNYGGSMPVTDSTVMHMEAELGARLDALGLAGVFTATVSADDYWEGRPGSFHVGLGLTSQEIAAFGEQPTEEQT